MNKDEARREIKPRLREYVESVTERSKGKMYKCPICGSGAGKSQTGAFSITPCGEKWKCFSCQNSGDIFDLIGHINAESNAGTQLGLACSFFGIELDIAGATRQKQAKTSHRAQSRPEHKAYTHTHTAEPEPEREADYTDLFLEAHRHIAETDYPQRRGINAEMIERFNLGFIQAWRNPKAPAAPATPRLIIPISAGSYLARDTREQQKEYAKLKVGQMHVFNVEAVKGQRPVFIVEGELDAISIIQAGGEAVALGSIAMTRRFLAKVEQLHAQCPFIIALDNETSEQVQKAANELEEGLERAGLASYRRNPCGMYKDANEALQRNSAGLRAAVKAIEQEVADFSRAEEAARRERHLKTSARYHLASFREGIAASVQTPVLPTGFFYLDKALDGGLYEGLYIVGAISSLGKTTFCMQIADQIAQAGSDVLIFSLEMARFELMAKSISRHTLEISINKGIDTKNAKTARGITNGARYAKYNEQEKQLIEEAVEAYSRYAERVFIHEGVGEIGAEQVRAVVAEHIRITGNKPVVIVDYLQILAPYSEKATDKQNTDKAVLELKRISRDYKLPLIGISSFNRANYKEAVTMEAFKESGAIEYSSDVLIGLQLKGAGKKDFDATEAKSRQCREIELVILKNRNGQTGKRVPFSYYPMFNFYKEEP